MANPKPRSCPPDFAITFVKIGRHDCEAWYRARRTTVTRWIAECGNPALLAERAAFIRFKRSRAKARKGAAHG